MIKYEHKSKPLLSKKKYYKRLINNILLAVVFLFLSLGIGIGGYMYFGKLSFVDSVLNASMILGGMGPVDVMHSDSAKYFASFYALYSGVALISSVGIIFSPIIHRMMHRLNLETDNEEDDNQK